MRVESGSALSAAASPEKVKQDKNSPAIRKNINTTLRHKQGNNVPETFLVPMVLRKTKLKQKQQSPTNNQMAAIPSNTDLHGADPRQQMLIQDLTLEPSFTNEEKEENRLRKLRNMKHLTFKDQTTTGANIVGVRAPSQCVCYDPYSPAATLSLI